MIFWMKKTPNHRKNLYLTVSLANYFIIYFKYLQIIMDDWLWPWNLHVFFFLYNIKNKNKMWIPSLFWMFASFILYILCEHAKVLIPVSHNTVLNIAVGITLLLHCPVSWLYRGFAILWPELVKDRILDLFRYITALFCLWPILILTKNDWFVFSNEYYIVWF